MKAASEDPGVLIRPRELHFLLHDWLGLEALLGDPRFSHLGRDTVDAVLELSEKVATETFLPHYKLSDRCEPHLGSPGVEVLPELAAALRNYAQLGLFGAGFAANLGGMGLPYVVACASFAQFAAANIASAAYPMLTVANARLIAQFGTPAQIECFALPQIQGRWFGTMCLSEPQAGSSLADIRTKAVADGEDALGPRYRLTGHKMWISGGDQNISDNIVHLVLAKIPAAHGGLPAGGKSLSLFIVPKHLPDGSRNDIVVAGINHKMGYRGTANCLLNFGEQSGAVGWRVGACGDGLPQMFRMMNEARLAVGIGAASLAYRGYRQSLHYAHERRQGRLAGVQDGEPVAIVHHPDVKRMLLTQKIYAEGALGLCLYCAKLVDERQPESVALLGLLTPVAKTWSSEYGLAANDIAIQVHGGYGYSRDFDAEQLYRDNRLNAIHEGTTGIQALDLLGRKVLRKGEQGLRILGQRIGASCVQAAAKPAWAEAAGRLESAWSRVGATVARLEHAGQAGGVLDNAAFFLAAFGHVVVAWLWLEQAQVAERSLSTGAGPADYLRGKLSACRFFFESELPRADTWLAIVSGRSDTAAAMAAEQF